MCNGTSEQVVLGGSTVTKLRFNLKELGKFEILARKVQSIFVFAILTKG